MKVYRKSKIAQIKGVRLKYDHLEQIIEWFQQEELSIEIETLGIDKTYKKYESIDLLIKSRGKRPKQIAITGKKDNETIQVFFYMQFCIIENINRKADELEYKIVRLMNLSIPRIFKFFSFKFYVLCLSLIFVSAIILSLILKDFEVLKYAIFPILGFILAGIYNNKVNGIYLIYAHEKTSFWNRNKDEIVLSIFTTLLITPLGLALWDYVIKPILDSYK